MISISIITENLIHTKATEVKKKKISCRRKQRGCFLHKLKEWTYLIQANVLIPAMFIAQEPHIPVEWEKKSLLMIKSIKIEIRNKNTI